MQILKKRGKQNDQATVWNDFRRAMATISNFADSTAETMGNWLWTRVKQNSQNIAECRRRQNQSYWQHSH